MMMSMVFLSTGLVEAELITDVAVEMRVTLGRR
jgi:hypothetical protein